MKPLNRSLRPLSAPLNSRRLLKAALILGGMAIGLSVRFQHEPMIVIMAFGGALVLIAVIGVLENRARKRVPFEGDKGSHGLDAAG